MSRAYLERCIASLMGVAVDAEDVSCCGSSRYGSIPVVCLKLLLSISLCIEYHID
jgi:hypothetical protein